MEDGTGNRYVDIASGETFDYQLKPGTDGMRMLALFGARTLMTNEASAERHGPRAGGPKEQMASIRERFALIDTGVWVDRTRDGGPRIDQAMLANAAITARVNAGVNVESDRATLYANLLKNWAADPKLVAIAHSVTAVRDEYAKLSGKIVRTLADLDAMSK
jgi:hypothetical protein